MLVTRIKFSLGHCARFFLFVIFLIQLFNLLTMEMAIHSVIRLTRVMVHSLIGLLSALFIIILDKAKLMQLESISILDSDIITLNQTIQIIHEM